MEDPERLPQILSGRRAIGVLNSPEFEFCNSFSQHNFLSADELFSGGVLLPLHHHLRPSNDVPTPSMAAPDPESEMSTTESAQLSAISNINLSSSKRWRDIFRKNDKKCSRRRSIDIDKEEKDIINGYKEKRREKKNGVGVSTAAAELNINIWPFSRSRSAGNGAVRPRSAAVPAAAARNVSSAPCSRSNSTGESKSRKWPSSSSPGRGGVHLGRSSPVWQVSRGGGNRGSEAVVRKDGIECRRKIPPPGSGGVGGRSKARTLSLSVPMCIGYKQHLSCRIEENSGGGGGGVAAGAGGGGGRSVSGEGVRGRNLFNIKSLFTKKVY